MAGFWRIRTGAMQNSAIVLPRTPLLGNLVNSLLSKSRGGDPLRTASSVMGARSPAALRRAQAVFSRPLLARPTHVRQEASRGEVVKRYADVVRGIGEHHVGVRHRC